MTRECVFCGHASTGQAGFVRMYSGLYRCKSGDACARRVTKSKPRKKPEHIDIRRVDGKEIRVITQK